MILYSQYAKNTALLYHGMPTCKWLKKIILTLPGAQLSLCSISLAVASSKTNGYTDGGAFRVGVNRGCHPCLFYVKGVQAGAKNKI